MVVRTPKERMHDWYLANKYRVRENSRKWTAKNRHRINARRRELWKLNPEKDRTRGKRYRDAHPSLIRICSLKKRFRKLGVSETEIARALAAWKEFQGICEACGTCCSSKFDTDHNHTTNKFRGIVGSKCNKALGLVGDDIDRLRALIAYLERTS